MISRESYEAAAQSLAWREHDCVEVQALCDRYKAALEYLLGQYERLVQIHEHVRMDTEEDRALHQRVIAEMREAAKPARAALEEKP